MRSPFYFFLRISTLLVTLVLAVSCEKTGPRELKIYAYDSFVSEWGPGPKITILFEKSMGIKAEFVSAGDAGAVLSKAILEKASPSADVIVGIDNFLYPRARAAGILAPYKSRSIGKTSASLGFDEEGYLTPFDYGYFAIIWDSARLADPPRSLEELADPAYSKKLILMDPRTSTPGLGFLYWTRAVYGDAYLDFWKRLSPSILTITDGWDSGYGLFVSGEAPLVLSYTTSPAYHMAMEKTERYKALVFPEGHCAQIEGVGILTGTKRLSAARAFVDFMLTDEVQDLIPETNWMFPAAVAAKLPASFAAAPRPEKILTVSEADRAAVDVTSWAAIVSGSIK